MKKNVKKIRLQKMVEYGLRHRRQQEKLRKLAAKKTTITLQFTAAYMEALKERAAQENLSVKAFMLEGIQIRFEYKKVSRLIEIDSSDRFPFGKHKDVKLRDVPTGYLKWAVAEATNLDESFRDRIRKELAHRTVQEDRSRADRPCQDEVIDPCV